MIQDSEKHTFQGILVYQLDRFARNRYDSAINKAKLKKNGVRVLSARENITEDASGILIEGVLESMAEYYSVELSQKINRGMQINASKCLSNGGKPGLGYKVDKDRRYYVDEEEAKIVREFNKNSLHRLLRNRRFQFCKTVSVPGADTSKGIGTVLTVCKQCLCATPADGVATAQAGVDGDETVLALL